MIVGGRSPMADARSYNPFMLFDTLTIVGVGLIGGSIGQAARQRKLAGRIVGVGRHADSLQQAQSAGAIDSFTLDISAGVAAADLIVFCTPVDKIVKQVLQAASSCRKGAIITDAGSTKANIVRDLERSLPAGIQFVGSHPLAGSEKRGAENASPDLFDGRVTVVTKTSDTDLAALERVKTFWQGLGSVVRILDPESHDHALALTSHMPHLAASALAGILPAQWQPLTASGFRDTTRIAAGDPALWTAIFRQNALATCDALQRFTDRLGEFREAIMKDDEATLIELLSQGKRVRDAVGS